MTDPLVWLALTGLAVILAAGVVRWSRRFFPQDPGAPAVRTWGQYSPMLTWLKYRRLSLDWQRLKALGAVRVNVMLLVEIALIVVWAGWVGQAYLDLDPFVWPKGREWGVQTQTHYFWVDLQQCGMCALWNGNMNGGVPALADFFGSKLHPLVVVTTLGWGVINGAKLALVAALAMAGLAQWWMARILGLGRVARLWSAGLSVAGGHLFGRMYTGQFGMVLSTAACSLVLAAALDLGITGRRRSAVVLALTLAMAAVAGQGYVQLSLLGWAPAFLILILDSNLRLRSTWREYALAIGLAILVAGVLLVPALHFLPNFTKPGDPLFKAAQPLEYVPLNFVIRDWDFMHLEALGRLPYPELYVMYIGWVPVLLSPLVLRYARREHIPALLWLGTGLGVSLLIASGSLIRWLTGFFPILAGFRHAPLLAVLAAPALLALAAYALDGLLRQDWPSLTLVVRSDGARLLGARLSWILALPLLWSLWSALQFSSLFLVTEDMRRMYDLVSQVRPQGVEWVAPPFGEHFWVEPGLYYGLKLAPVVYPAAWKGREQPQPQLMLSRNTQLTDIDQVGIVGDVPVYRLRDSAYAYVVSGSQTFPCLATGRDGDLDITCVAGQPGQLVVREYSWNGWYATQDGQPAALGPSIWLSVAAPAGEHHFSFRYRPWDVWLGLALTVAGLALCAWLWIRAETAPPAPAQTP